MKTLLIIGRFQPFHLGHLHVIKKYSKDKFFIKIGIGSSEKYHEKKNPFTNIEREEMIRLTLKENKIKNYKIYHIPDKIDDTEWVKNVKNKIGGFEILFTGNKHVKKLLKDQVKIHYLNEKEKPRDISATNIRKKWLECKSKKGLPEAVFNYLKKIRALDRLKELHNNKKKVHYLLKEKKLSISVAESCTGGSISRALISYSGSSEFFKLGFVAYDINSKIKEIGVSKRVIKKYGSISREVCKEMAIKVRKKVKTDYSISSTGYADPLDQKAGLIYLSIASLNNIYVKKLNIKLKDREKIIGSATKKAIEFLYDVLKKEVL